MRMVDLCGMRQVERTTPWFNKPHISTITIEPEAKAEAMAQQWEALKVECFWTDGS
jgi:hypothetical protein